MARGHRRSWQRCRHFLSIPQAPQIAKSRSPGSRYLGSLPLHLSETPTIRPSGFPDTGAFLVPNPARSPISWLLDNIGNSDSPIRLCSGLLVQWRFIASNLVLARTSQETSPWDLCSEPRRGCDRALEYCSISNLAEMLAKIRVVRSSSAPARLFCQLGAPHSHGSH